MENFKAKDSILWGFTHIKFVDPVKVLYDSQIYSMGIPKKCAEMKYFFHILCECEIPFYLKTFRLRHCVRNPISSVRCREKRNTEGLHIGTER